MSSSASKLTGGQGQHRQHTSTLLHPAAAVFRDEILGDVGDRNKTLEVNNARFRHLANVIHDIELSFYTAYSRRGEQENHFHIEHHETFTVKQKLSRGSIITTLNGEHRLVLPIEDAPAHPVEDCGAIGCVELYMAGDISFGSFSEHRFYFVDAAKMSVEEDGSVLLTLHLSKDIVIKGKLHSSQMGNAALIEHIEQPDFMTFLKMGAMGSSLFRGSGEYRKGIFFTPLSISIQVTPLLKETLALVDQLSSSGGSKADVELESEDELRCLVVEALGDSEHKELFSEYIALKHENQALAELRSLILGVSVSHSRGLFMVTLDEGMKSDNFWSIPGSICDRCMIPVAELHSMQASFLGMQLRLDNGLASAHLETHPFRRDLWVMPYLWGRSKLKIFFFLTFNWSDCTEEEVRDIDDRFPSKMRNALGLRSFAFDRDDTATFPLTFKASVVGITRDLSWAKSRLEWAGLWEE